jgi:hypothetical protein
MTVLLGLVAALAAVSGPCDLVDRGVVTRLLGHPITATSPAPEQRDAETGGMLSYCTYEGGPAGLVVSVVRFGNVAEARHAATRRLAARRLDEANATVEEEGGLGDRAFWAYTEEGAEWVVLKGTVLIGVALGGRADRPPGSLKSLLREATVAAMAKL